MATCSNDNTSFSIVSRISFIDQLVSFVFRKLIVLTAKFTVKSITVEHVKTEKLFISSRFIEMTDFSGHSSTTQAYSVDEHFRYTVRVTIRRRSTVFQIALLMAFN